MAPEQMDDLRGRVVQSEHGVTELRQRVATIEIWRAQKDVADAKDGVVLETLLKRMDKIDAGISKILWAIFSAVILAIVTWMLSGGLKSAKDEVSKANLFGYPESTITSLEKETTCPSEKPVYVASYCRKLPTFAKSQ